MNYNLTTKFNPSFGKVIPIKKIVFDDNSSINYEQMSFDSFSGSPREKIDDSCDPTIAQKTIRALNKILLKNDGAEKNTFKNALNNMIRTSFATADKDYKIPARPVDSSHNSTVRPCYCGTRNYILTGKDAADYADAGEDIGNSRALVRDYQGSDYLILKSKRSFAEQKQSIINRRDSRLKGNYENNLGLVIYADKTEVPKAGNKGTKTEINIKGIDFEPV